jgi:C-terminal processing protease CtpA/Prc
MSSEGLPVVVAQPVDNAAVHPDSGLPLKSRAVSVVFYKPTKDTKLGLHFEHVGHVLGKTTHQLAISKIDPDTPAAASPLRVGDKLMKLFSKDVHELTNHQANQYIEELEGPIKMVFLHQAGHNTLVEAMMTKSKPDEKIGLGFKKDNFGVYISSIDPEKISHLIILRVGDRVLSINGVPLFGKKLKDVADMIAQAPSTVTIVAQTTKEIVAEITNYHL